jgi:hypothetical protein
MKYMKLYGNFRALGWQICLSGAGWVSGVCRFG